MKTPVYIKSNNTYIRKSGNHLIIDIKGNKIPCPSENVNYLVKWGNSQISEQVLNFFAEKGIIVFRCSYGNKFNGVILPPESNIGKSRLKQYEAYFNNEKRLKIAKEIIKTSSENKIKVLKRHYYKSKKESVIKNINSIKKYIKELEDIKELESLRGKEGIIGKNYFESFKTFFKFYRIETREYNPPPDEINCLLSFTYSLLYFEIASRIQEHGLCIFLGYLHEQNNSALALAYDLSEMFKQEIDLIVLGLINNKQIKDEYFNKKEDGACLLNTYGKTFILKEWNKYLLKTRKDIVKDRISFREILVKEVIKLKRHLEEGDKYEGYRL